MTPMRLSLILLFCSAWFACLRGAVADDPYLFAYFTRSYAR